MEEIIHEEFNPYHEQARVEWNREEIAREERRDEYAE